MEQRLQKLMKELGQAINESISDSEQIAEVIAKIKSGGYDVFLVLEATIGFNKREEEETKQSSAGDLQEIGPRFQGQPSRYEVSEVVAHQHRTSRQTCLSRPGPEKAALLACCDRILSPKCELTPAPLAKVCRRREGARGRLSGVVGSRQETTG